MSDPHAHDDDRSIAYTLSNDPHGPGTWKIDGTNAHQDGVLSHSVDKETRTYVGPTAKARALEAAKALDACCLDFVGTAPDGSPLVFVDLDDMIAYDEETARLAADASTAQKNAVEGRRHGRNTDPKRTPDRTPAVDPEAEHFHAIDGSTEVVTTSDVDHGAANLPLGHTPEGIPTDHHAPDAPFFHKPEGPK